MRRLLTAFAILGAVLANTAAVHVTHASSGTAPATRAGKILGMVLSHKIAGTASAPSSAGALHYNNGPVMQINKVYAIYWVPPGYSVDQNYISLINRYFGDVQADHGKISNVYATDTQYSQQMNGAPSPSFIQNNSTFEGAAVDTDMLPPYDPVNCPQATTGGTAGLACVTDAQLQQEISTVIKANHWPVDNNTEFFMFTAKNISSCVPGQEGISQAGVGTYVTVPICAFSYYCAYHSWYFDSTVNPNSQIIYANMPYADTVSPNCAPQNSIGTSGITYYRPNNDDADATINVVSHEHNESITDPFGTGWWDSNPNDSTAGQENGDLCAWTFGSVGADGANQTINGHRYIMQQEYDNYTSGCLQTETPQFSLTPNIGYPTAPFKIDNLTFLPANSTVNFTFTSPGSSTPESLGSVTADATGHATKFMTSVPADALAGTATIAATPNDGETGSTTSFTVPAP